MKYSCLLFFGVAASLLICLVQTVSAQTTQCGACQDCTNVWNTQACEIKEELGGQEECHSCGARITYMREIGGLSSEEACREIGRFEFPSTCGACNPDDCEQAVGDGDDNNDNSSPTQPPAGIGDDISGFSPPTTNTKSKTPLTPQTTLYCFPNYNDRTRYENVWNKYTVEVKEGHACGPSDNKFSTDTVSLTGTDDDLLKLQFKKVNGLWEGSEVRVVLPQEEMPFHYGNYSFSVKSIEVIDSSDGAVVDTKLPISMILGLFTWDDTEDYSIHENYNHEVDVEISRWNEQGNADAQFLVQPPGDPHSYRFFTGNGGDDTTSYNQAPHVYTFDWRPAEIEWYSDAGGGHRFVYSTQDAMAAGATDYTQCMPANVEVRLNLWHLFGSSTAPEGMEDGHVVEVVIDNFSFTPSAGLTAVQDGGACSKDCHCGPLSECRLNFCTFVGGSNKSDNDNGGGDDEDSDIDTSDNDNGEGDNEDANIDTSDNDNGGDDIETSDNGGDNEDSNIEASDNDNGGVDEDPNIATYSNDEDDNGGTISAVQDSASASQTDGGLSKAGLSLIVIVCLVFAGIMFLLVIDSRRRRRNSKTALPVYVDAEETASFSGFEMSLEEFESKLQKDSEKSYATPATSFAPSEASDEEEADTDTDIEIGSPDEETDTAIEIGSPDEDTDTEIEIGGSPDEDTDTETGSP